MKHSGRVAKRPGWGGIGWLAAAALVISLAAGRLAAKEPTPAYSATEFQEAVKFLASTELKGRGDGSKELDKAAAYIAKRFRKFDLQPAGDNRTYLQHFMMTVGAKLGPKNSLAS